MTGGAVPRTKEGLTRRAGIQPVRCAARRRDGTPCRQWALVGQGVCRMHGGSSPQALARQDARVGVEQLLRARLGAEADLPLDAAALLAANDAKLMYLDARRITPPLTVEQVERVAEAMRYFLGVQRLVRELGVEEKVALRGEQYAAVLVRGAGLVLNALAVALRPLGEDYMVKLRTWLRDVIAEDLRALREVYDPDRTLDMPTRPVDIPPPELPCRPADERRAR
jgi:hypothetical protein